MEKVFIDIKFLKRIDLPWTITLFLAVLLGCQHIMKNEILNRLQPVPVDSGFKMANYWIWCGSIIKVDSTYHLFASRWPKGNAFPVDYLKSSEIVRTTAKSILGPYEFREVVIGERDSSYWDSNMAHNPIICKIGNNYVLFYIGCDFNTMRPGSKSYLRRIGYAVARNIEGPWHRSDKPVINRESNNPSILLDSGKIKLLFRDENLRVFLAEADSISGNFKILNDNVWPASEIEDFCLYKMENKYHFLCEEGIGYITGHERWGADLYSEYGIHNWKKFGNGIAYNHDIRLNNDSAMHCIRRERPQLVIENNMIECLVTAVYDGKNSWCQPVMIQPLIELMNKGKINIYASIILLTKCRKT
jgi:hypothetical protein